MYSNCPNCNKEGIKLFYEVKNVPVHSVLLMDTAEEALNYPKRDIKLGFCPFCGFISNLVFDPAVHEYSSKYEETQGFSPTFKNFHRNLAQKLIDKHDLHHKNIIEIGCGKGEFLTLLCELGDNTGYGFDPAWVSERSKNDSKLKIEFIKDFYSEKYAHYKGDFVCCKMTLEHIPDTFHFMKIVRSSLENNLDALVFFQVPDVERILKDLGFWDIYYEHCSYFSEASLSRLFELTGFEVLEIGKEYDDQYLMIEARPKAVDANENSGSVYNLNVIGKEVKYFSENINKRLQSWIELLRNFKKRGKKVVLWGGGSKAVAFLTTLGIIEEIKYAVDINPYKHGTFLTGNGQKIVSPKFLKELVPDVVIVMNPIYMKEIQKDLNDMGLYPDLLPIDFMDKDK